MGMRRSFLPATICVAGLGAAALAIADPVGSGGLRRAMPVVPAEAALAPVDGAVKVAAYEADGHAAQGNGAYAQPAVMMRASFAQPHFSPSDPVGGGTAMRQESADDTGQQGPQQGETPPVPFSFDTVITKARVLSRQPHERLDGNVPKTLSELTYEQYVNIDFRHEAADWTGGRDNFQVHYAPQGFLFKTPVTVNLVEGGTVRERAASPEDFSFNGVELSEEEEANLHYAGVRLTAPLNDAGKFDEFLSFLGASYFRALGAKNQYGVSARGLAVSTASPSGEEFPVFREFWLEQPDQGSMAVSAYALLDSPSVTGAYKFTARPGSTTLIDVEAVLFPRRDLSDFGLAPLTSMFDFSPQDPAPGRLDYRARVHDSDGLMIRLRNGEWVWRPLSNPSQLEISSFTQEVPYGFGLMQRARDFDEYQDLETRYDLRPSVWIEPRGEWGPGRLVLVEIPTSNEFNDNIVTFWRPDETWKSGEERRFAYTMHWGNDAPIRPSIARVERTRTGTPVNAPDHQLFVIDFESGSAALLDGAEVNVSASTGEVTGVTLQENPVTGGRRLTFELDPAGTNMSELRAVLTRNGLPVSETWLYRWRRP